MSFSKADFSTDFLKNVGRSLSPWSNAAFLKGKYFVGRRDRGGREEKTPPAFL
jgi:hypothetical protein